MAVFLFQSPATRSTTLKYYIWLIALMAITLNLIALTEWMLANGYGGKQCRCNKLLGNGVPVSITIMGATDNKHVQCNEAGSIANEALLTLC